jgi:hypothetical protein
MTDLFSHITVLLSIVIALGMAELVSAWGELLRNRIRVRFYWLHLFWSVFIIMIMIQMWWGLWNFRTIDDWTIAAPTALVVQSLILVLTAQMISPKVDLSTHADMKEFYYDSTKVFFIPSGLLMISLAFNDIMFLEQPIIHAENIVRGAGVVICAIAAFSNSERVHAALAAIALASFIGFIAIGISY